MTFLLILTTSLWDVSHGVHAGIIYLHVSVVFLVFPQRIPKLEMITTIPQAISLLLELDWWGSGAAPQMLANVDYTYEREDDNTVHNESLSGLIHSYVPLVLCDATRSLMPALSSRNHALPGQYEHHSLTTGQGSPKMTS